jgi:hypothetical protein
VSSRLQEVAPLPVEEVARALEDVLARPEFSDEVPWWQRVLDRIGEGIDEVWEWLFGDLFEDVELPGAPDNLEAILTWVLFGLALVALGWIVFRYARNLPTAARKRRLAVEASQQVRELRRRAGEARQAGDLRLALRLTFFALVVGLGRRGTLEYRDAWTNRELLARGRPSPDVSTLLAPLVDELDRKMFGRDETTAADLERLESLCSRWLESEGVRS